MIKNSTFNHIQNKTVFHTIYDFKKYTTVRMGANRGPLNRIPAALNRSLTARKKMSPGCFLEVYLLAMVITVHKSNSCCKQLSTLPINWFLSFLCPTLSPTGGQDAMAFPSQWKQSTQGPTLLFTMPHQIPWGPHQELLFYSIPV